MSEVPEHFGMFDRAELYADRTAVVSGESCYTYENLGTTSDQVFSNLADFVSSGERIAFLLDPSFAYVAVQWGIWKTQCIAVPLCAQHPPPALSYVLRDAEVSLVISQSPYLEALEALGDDLNLPILDFESLDLNRALPLRPVLPLDGDAMILYTSGTTNEPKGVVSTFYNIQSQIRTLVEAWQWSAEDQVLNVLPLHHVHGIINVVCCALWSGARVQFLRKFDAGEVFTLFLRGRINVFMAVPTIYHKLIAYWRLQEEKTRMELSACMANFRLMVSGSAALPVTVLEQWQVISGLVLLERYGMTEIGMALSNPYDGIRRPGHVGQALPGVEVRLVDQEKEVLIEGESGEIQVKGASVFSRYWNKPEATASSFTVDGWFRTGDVALLDEGYYRILGRSSVDIIKSGGYKISALEIESCLLQHEAISECAVVGLEDDEWGQVVAAVLVHSKPLTVDNLRDWLKQRLATYQLPRRFLFVDRIPCNTIGKTTKKEVVKLFLDSI